VKRAFAAEWGKTWALRSSWFAVPAAVLLTVVTAMTLANDFRYDIDQHRLPPTETLAVIEPLGAGFQLGMLALVALAMLVVTAEYGTGLIRATFLARPRRGDVLLAKTAVAVLVGVAGGLLCGAAGWVAARLVLGHFTAPGEAVPAVLRIGAVAGLACALTVAVASVLRSAAGTLTTVFVLLVGLQVLDFAYSPAAGAVRFVADASATGAAVLVAWTVAAQAIAHVLLVRRDA
jgi:ABC-2 type transport system permease protein